MRGLILLADYFEDIEAIGTIDCLRRANITIDLVSVVHKYDLITQSGIKIQADKLFEDVQLSDYQFVILPGGKAVFQTHLNSKLTKETIDYFMKQHLLVGAICAAPMVLAPYLKNQPFTSFPSTEKNIAGQYQNSKVEIVDNIITSKAAGTTFEFASAIISYLLSEEKAQVIMNSIYYEK